MLCTWLRSVGVSALWTNKQWGYKTTMLTRNAVPTGRRETAFRMMPYARTDGLTRSTIETNLLQVTTFGPAFRRYIPGSFGFLTVLRINGRRVD